MKSTTRRSFLGKLAIIPTAALVSLIGCEKKGTPRQPQKAEEPKIGPIARLQAKCWTFKLEWHHKDGWVVTAKWYKEAALGTSSVTAETKNVNPDQAIADCLKRIG